MRTNDKTIRELEQLLSVIRRLSPTCEEIRSYGIKHAGFEQVTYAGDQTYFGPYLHNTKALNEYGPIHIDLGCGGIHLMLSKGSATTFIEYLRDSRPVD